MIDKQKLDIVCLSLSRWDAPISSPALSLAKELARTNRVFYIEHPFSWKDYWKERRSPQIRLRREALLHGRNIYHQPGHLPPNLTIVTSRLVYPINILPPGRLYDKLAELNDGIVLRTLRQLARERQLREFVFLNFFDPYYLRTLPPDLRPFRYIYQCMDDLAEVPYTRRHGVRLEQDLVRRADLTLCTSRELTRLMSAHSPRVRFHPNAADVALFSRARGPLPRPADLPEGRRIIGFTGSIEYRTDFELLCRVADRHPDKLLFLLGPVQGNEYQRSGLNRRPNVHFAGPRRLEELPAYLRYMDCCIIPYKKNKLTRSIYPLKLHEYLAAGRPVVATGFSEDIRGFAEQAYIAETAGEFCELIDRAIREDSPALQESRAATAAANSWSVRVEQLWEWILDKANEDAE